MIGASFGGSASLGSTIAPSHFERDANFTLATFGDTADFENVSFANATFDLARFKGDAIFAGGMFNAPFAGPASFQRTSFGGTADFRDRVFDQAPDFTEATFAGRSDFSGLTEFKHGATFEETAFGPATSFLAAKFEGNASDATSLDHITSSGTIDFSAAEVSAPLRVLNSVVGGLTFAHVLYGSGGTLTLDSVTSPSFYFDIGSLRYVNGGDASSTVHDRETALSLLEASSKADNNLSLANDAHYRLESLKSTQYREPFHLIDLFFYNWIAGYLVRPDHPIFTLLAIALLVSLVRAFTLVPEPRTAGDPAGIHRARGGDRRQGGAPHGPFRHLAAHVGQAGLRPLRARAPRHVQANPARQRSDGERSSCRGVRVPTALRLHADRFRELEPDPEADA
jgi:hypothetical protein